LAIAASARQLPMLSRAEGLGSLESQCRGGRRRAKKAAAGDYLRIVSGNEDDLHHVESIMGDRNVEEFEIFGGKDYTREDVQVDRTHRNTATTVAGRDLDQDGEPDDKR